MVSITALEKSVKLWASKLEEQGYTVSVYVFRSGKGNNGVSYVDLAVDGHRNVQFIANGNAAYEARQIGGYTLTWSEMKAIAKKKMKI